MFQGTQGGCNWDFASRWKHKAEQWHKRDIPRALFLWQRQFHCRLPRPFYRLSNTCQVLEDFYRTPLASHGRCAQRLFWVSSACFSFRSLLKKSSIRYDWFSWLGFRLRLSLVFFVSSKGRALTWRRWNSFSSVCLPPTDAFHSITNSWLMSFPRLSLDNCWPQTKFGRRVLAELMITFQIQVRLPHGFQTAAFFCLCESQMSSMTHMHVMPVVLGREVGAERYWDQVWQVERTGGESNTPGKS